MDESDSCTPITEWQVQWVADLLSCYREWRSMFRKAGMPDEYIVRAEQTHAGKDITESIFDAILKWTRAKGPISACQMYLKFENIPQRRQLYEVLLADHKCPVADQAAPTSIMLVGATGSGKSSTGNSIIGEDVFETEFCAQSVTTNCKGYETSRHGFPITVVDTPGLFDTDRSDEEISAELEKVVEMTYPGPNAFCLVIRAGRFSKEQHDAMQKIKDTFGEDVLKYTIILFTGMDELKKKKISLDQFIQKGPESLKDLVASCENRYMGIDNETDDQKLKDEHLHQMFDYMKEIKNGKDKPYYTNAMLEMAKKQMQERLEKKHQFQEAETRKKIQLEFDMKYKKHEAEMSAISETIATLSVEKKQQEEEMLKLNQELAAANFKQKKAMNKKMSTMNEKLATFSVEKKQQEENMLKLTQALTAANAKQSRAMNIVEQTNQHLEHLKEELRNMSENYTGLLQTELKRVQTEERQYHKTQLNQLEEQWRKHARRATDKHTEAVNEQVDAYKTQITKLEKKIKTIESDSSCSIL